MAKIIGFREDFKREHVTLGESQCYEIRNLVGLTKGRSSSSTPYFNMVQDGPDWSIGYQKKLRFFLDDGKIVALKTNLKRSLKTRIFKIRLTTFQNLTIFKASKG